MKRKNNPTLKQLFDKARRQRLEIQKKAGRHRCRPVPIGVVQRLTGFRNGKEIVLKRPVVIRRVYECEICLRTINPKNSK